MTQVAYSILSLHRVLIALQTSQNHLQRFVDEHRQPATASLWQQEDKPHLHATPGSRSHVAMQGAPYLQTGAAATRASATPAAPAAGSSPAASSPARSPVVRTSCSSACARMSRFAVPHQHLAPPCRMTAPRERCFAGCSPRAASPSPGDESCVALDTWSCERVNPTGSKLQEPCAMWKCVGVQARLHLLEHGGQDSLPTPVHGRRLACGRQRGLVYAQPVKGAVHERTSERGRGLFDHLRPQRGQSSARQGGLGGYRWPDPSACYPLLHDDLFAAMLQGPPAAAATALPPGSPQVSRGSHPSRCVSQHVHRHMPLKV